MSVTRTIPAMWSPRIVPQPYPWIDGVMVKKKDVPCTIISAIYGADVQSTELKLSLPVTLSPGMDITKMWGDPAFGRPKKLTVRVRCPGDVVEDITINEMCGRWERPIYLQPGSTLDFVVQGGLSNQIYQVAAACFIAKQTSRQLTFPFRLLARRTCMDQVCTLGKPAKEVDVSFSHLFDADYFALHCGVSLCRLAEGDTVISNSVTFNDADGKMVEEKELPDWRYIAGEKAEAPMPESPLRSTEVASYYYTPHKHISVPFPFVLVAPSTLTHYNFFVDTILALKPAPRLQTIADTICARLDAEPNLLAVHCRIEDDWEAACPGSVLSPEAMIREIKSARIAGITAIYVVGNADNDSYWAALKSKAPEYKWIRKEDCGISGLGFDEGGVVDRDVASRVPHFLGFGSSTLSLVVVLHRHRMKKPYALYGKNHIGTWSSLYYKDNKPLYDYLA